MDFIEIAKTLEILNRMDGAAGDRLRRAFAFTACISFLVGAALTGMLLTVILAWG